MTKALFFDIDGTLVSFRTHRIPQSAVDALTEAHRRGTGIFISTGRPRSIINNLGAISHLIDGYITANGAYCFAGKEVVACSPVDNADARAMIRRCDETGTAIMVVGEHDLTMHNATSESIHIFRDLLKVDNLGLDTPVEKVLQQRILQLTPFVTADREHEIITEPAKFEAGRWHPGFVDLTAAGVSKAEGLRAMARHLGIRPTETMAFGDGGNDLSIILAAGTGVAMGNANEVLLKAADYVTSSVDDDGIRNALLHFGVI